MRGRGVYSVQERPGPIYTRARSLHSILPSGDPVRAARGPTSIYNGAQLRFGIPNVAIHRRSRANPSRASSQLAGRLDGARNGPRRKHLGRTQGFPTGGSALRERDGIAASRRGGEAWWRHISLCGREASSNARIRKPRQGAAGCSAPASQCRLAHWRSMYARRAYRHRADRR